MTTQYADQNSYGESYGGAGTSGASGQSDDLNMGSARSDYGKYAYGGRLDKRGMDKSRDRGWRSFRRGGSRHHWWGKGLMALGGTAVGIGVGVAIGAGIGAAAMYMLDPAQGKDRRDSARRKLNDASHKATDMLGKRSHDLRERARGALAGARRTPGTGEDVGGMTMSRSASQASDAVAGESRVEASASRTPSGRRTVTS